MLHYGHRATWLVVVVFLLDFFISIILFGVQSGAYENWCLSVSHNVVDEHIVLSNGNTLSILPQPDYFNCKKLWEDEIKLAIAVFIFMTICYVRSCLT